MDHTNKHILTWRVYAAVMKMMTYRGFSDETIISEQDFYDRITIHYTDELRGLAETFDKGILNSSMTHLTEPKTVLVMFPNELTIGRKHISDLVERMSILGADHCILVYGNTLTSSAKKDIEKHPGYYIEAFSESEMLYNVMYHASMPKCSILPKREKQTLFGNKSFIRDSQLPRISTTDKAARYMGLRRGEIVRIERESQTAGVTVSYRICV